MISGCGGGGDADPRPANAPPVAGDDTFIAVQDSTLTLPLARLLVNDTDPENDALQVVDIDPTSQAGGRLTINGSSWSYQPPAGFSGSDQWLYRVSDGGTTVSGIVRINVTSQALAVVGLSDFTVSQQTYHDISISLLGASSAATTAWQVTPLTIGAAYLTESTGHQTRLYAASNDSYGLTVTVTDGTRQFSATAQIMFQVADNFAVQGTVSDDNAPAPAQVGLLWLRPDPPRVIATDSTVLDGSYMFDQLIDQLEQYDLSIPPSPPPQ